jgi:hypothetical protein
MHSVLPLDFQRIAGFDRRPGVGGNDGHAVEWVEFRGRDLDLDFQYLYDTRNLQCRGGVVTRYLAAEHRRSRDHGVQHSVKPRVDPVLGFAGDDVGSVGQLSLAFADVTELRRCLEPQGITRWHRELGRLTRQGTKPKLASALAMDHFVIHRFYLVDRHAPARRRGLLEHGSRRCAAATHRFEKVSRAARAVGVLVAIFQFIRGRLSHTHPTPVGLQLVCDDERHAGAHALPHLRAVYDNGDQTVFADREKREGIVAPAMRHGVGTVLRGLVGLDYFRQPGYQHQTTHYP